MKPAQPFTGNASRFILIVAVLGTIAVAVGFVLLGPYGAYDITCAHFEMPGHEKAFGFRLGSVTRRGVDGGTDSSTAIAWVDPHGAFARSGFEPGDMPVAHHGIAEICGALQAAREGRPARIRLFRSGVLQEREIAISPELERSAAGR